MGYIYSGRHIYLAIQYLKNIKHYADEDGWIYPDNSELGKYTYKWVLEFTKNHCGTPNDLWNDLFMAEEPLRNLCEHRKIIMIDQLMHYAREWEASR